jgi:hypothetical protein
MRAQRIIDGDDPLSVFSAAEVAGLREHLQTVLPEAARLETAVLAIAIAFQDAVVAINNDDGALTPRLKAERDHFRQVAAHARALRVLLESDAHPLYLTLSSRFPGASPSWFEALEEAAELHIALATPSSAHYYESGATRGRPPRVWRDRLIATVYSVYPPRAAKITENSHFEGIVAMLLGLLEPKLQDIHGLIVDALKRRPVPVRVA